MIAHNNFNYFITYILFSCLGHVEVLLHFQQTLALSLGANQGEFTFNSHDCLTYIKQHMTAKSVHNKD
jgi:hypothetical protein